MKGAWKNSAQKEMITMRVLCDTQNKSLGYKVNDLNWKLPETVYDKLKEINGNVGNFLLNVGPDGDGNVPPESAEIFIEVGKMLKK